MKGRLKQTQSKLDFTEHLKKTNSGIWISGSPSKRDVLFRKNEDCIILSDEKVLRHPDLIMKPTDRIALCGPNGSGKSSLIQHLLPKVNITKDNLIYIPQEISLEKTKLFIDEVRSLPNDQQGQIMTIVSRLGSDPKRLLQSPEPSPGEMRKLMLALGILKDPHLIIMDEPTNHLDIIAVQCFEEALADCPCGLLLISHDVLFLNALTEIRWDVNVSFKTKTVCELRIT